MGLDTKFFYVSWLVGVPWMLLISGAYFVWKSKNAPPVTGAAVSKL
jgi:hypothetical protein